MSYDSGFSVDELVDQKHKFVNKVVVLNGQLTKYKMGPGAFAWPLELTIEGERRKIVAKCKIIRFQGEHWLRPHLDAFMGKTIGLKVFADNYTIAAMKFGENEFSLRA